MVWSWFPVGLAGIRTLLLFISALSVFVLRVASLHLGEEGHINLENKVLMSFRVTDDAITLLNLHMEPHPSEKYPNSFLVPLLCLVVQRSIHMVRFRQSRLEVDHRGKVRARTFASGGGKLIEDRPWEPTRLNERAIYLRSVFFMYAIAQSLLHIYYDYDEVPLPITPFKVDSITPQAAGLPAWFASQVGILRPMFLLDVSSVVNSIPQNIILRTICVSLLGPFLYGIFVRRTAWSWSLSLAALLWDVPPSRLSYIPPHYPSLVYRSITGGILLHFLWQSSNALFTAYVARQPIKKEQPLSSESKDPNGTLLNGLKSKKEVPKVRKTCMRPVSKLKKI